MTRSAVVVLTIVLLAGAGWTAAQGRRTAPEPPLAAFDVMEKSIEDLQRAMQAGAVTSRQLVDLYLARIAAYDQGGPALNAITVLNPQARSTAEALDAERQSGRVRGPLHGIPVLVKDNYETVEMPTSAGSIALAGFHPARDATLVKKLKDAGAVVLGKTNMHELAAGIVTVGSRFGQTRNPYDLDRNPGGSSGGTGAAVAANFAAAGMGSDTCGSIRIPAANNNLVGLRGTQGLSSRTGIVPLSTTQDIGGPIARSIADLALMLDATVGADPSDPSTAESAAHIPPSYRAMLGDASLNGARLGVVRELIGDAPEDQEVAAVLNRSLEALKKAGVTAIDVTVPGLNELLRDSSMIAFDFKFDLADYLRKDGHAPVASLGEILERGLYHSALESTFRLRNATESRDNDQSRRARIKRVALRQALEAVLAEHQLTALVYPSLRRKPARIGDAQLGTQCQVSAHSGLPALGLPAGFSDDEVPVGMELLGGAYKEVDLLKLGAAIEKALALRRPPFSTPALVAGRRPAAKGMTVGTAAAPAGASPRGVADPAVVTFSYDVTTSRLGYKLDAVAASVVAVWLHSGTPDKPGAARHQLYHATAPAERSGTVVLSAADRRDIAAGRFMVRVYSAGAAASLDRALTFR